MAFKFLRITTPVNEAAPKLPAAYVRKVLAEHLELIKLRDDLPALIEESQKRVDAAMQFAPDNFDVETEDSVHVSPPPATASASVPVPPPREPEQLRLNTSTIKAVAHKGRRNTRAAISQKAPRLTWVSEVSRVLDKADTGLTHAEVREELRSSEIDAKAVKGDKGFYMAIANLHQRGDLVKKGGLLYSAAVAHRILREGGELPDVVFESNRRKGGSAAIIIDVLYEHPKGLNSAELKEIVATVAEAPRSLREHSQYIYNILASTIGAGDVVKVGDKYFLTDSRRDGMHELNLMNE